MLHSADLPKATDAPAKGSDGRQSPSRWCQPLRRKFANGFCRRRDNRLARSPVTSLISLGRREMCFVARPLAVFLGAIILFAATASSSLAQKRTPLQTIEFPPGYETVVVIAELKSGECTGRHGHPGIESAY